MNKQRYEEMADRIWRWAQAATNARVAYEKQLETERRITDFFTRRF